MLRLEARKYLFDILQACDLLVQFTSGRSLTDYSADALLRSAVERQFEIIGEALGQALRLDPSLSSHISDTHRIIAFRNRLIHGYDSLADEIVWGVLEANLPVLRREVQFLLQPPVAEP
ncbi:MAG TPA: HepT-like ribonuclease domain-containing protein [Terriglobia bacterium]|nr:HepT-like ribonuclease domain-containing protein [Terriglobia bacterium]